MEVNIVLDRGFQHLKQVAAKLLAAGARPRRTALSGVESLTPSELRVAELAAHGMTNREIAQALFVTEKTVETHLGHVYPKLDITSRAELRGKLSRPESGTTGSNTDEQVPAEPSRVSSGSP